MEVLRGTKSAIDIIKIREDPFVVRNEITSTSFFFRHKSDFLTSIILISHLTLTLPFLLPLFYKRDLEQNQN